MQYFPLFALFSLLLMSSCSEEPDFEESPLISFLDISLDTISQTVQGEGDVFEVTISFEDGDGDIGNFGDQSGITTNAFFWDARYPLDVRDTSNAHHRFVIPQIPEQGSANGISGEITFPLASGTNDNICCLPEDLDDPNTILCQVRENPLDTLVFFIQIIDQSGNFSNVIETNPIYIRCD